MKYLLDTHIFLWWYLDDPQLPDRCVKLLTETEEAGEDLGVSIISLWEIAKLVMAGRFKITFSLDQWFAELETDPGISILPLTGRVILESTRLGPKFPKDPADQLIAATARCHGLRLMTVDERIVDSGMIAVA